MSLSRGMIEVPEIFKCSKCDKVISETLADRTFREYGHALCMSCGAALSPQLITTKPKPADLAKPDKQGESVPAPGAQREAPRFDKRITVNIGSYESLTLGVSGASSFEECDLQLRKELEALGFKHRGVRGI